MPILRNISILAVLLAPAIQALDIVRHFVLFIGIDSINKFRCPELPGPQLAQTSISRLMEEVSCSVLTTYFGWILTTKESSRRMERTTGSERTS